MPVIKSAKKKLRKDIKREKGNDIFRLNLKKSIKAVKKTPNEKTISAAVKAIDKAAKKNIIHKNKAARIKSKFSKLISSKVKTIKAPVAPKNKTPKSTKKTSK